MRDSQGRDRRAMLDWMRRSCPLSLKAGLLLQVRAGAQRNLVMRWLVLAVTWVLRHK